MPYQSLSTQPYQPTTTNDATGHNGAVGPIAAALNIHSHDPSDTSGNFGNGIPAWGPSNALYSAHGPGAAGSDWATNFNGSAAIPADPAETVVVPTGSITASFGIAGELQRIRGQLARVAAALLANPAALWNSDLSVPQYVQSLSANGSAAVYGALTVTAGVGIAVTPVPGGIQLDVTSVGPTIPGGLTYADAFPDTIMNGCSVVPGAGLNVTVNTGVGYVNGGRSVLQNVATVLCTANATTYIWWSGQVNGVSSNTTGTNPGNCMLLAQVAVPNGASSILAGYITDKRLVFQQASHGGVSAGSSYTSNEQNMLNDAYKGLRALKLLA